MNRQSSPTSNEAPTSAYGASLVHAHPADDLFDAKFPLEQATSERVDIIAAARARDLRANRFTKWGVK
jgi:hypothetical protein